MDANTTLILFAAFVFSAVSGVSSVLIAVTALRSRPTIGQINTGHAQVYQDQAQVTRDQAQANHGPAETVTQTRLPYCTNAALEDALAYLAQCDDALDQGQTTLEAVQDGRYRGDLGALLTALELTLTEGRAAAAQARWIAGQGRRQQYRADTSEREVASEAFEDLVRHGSR